MVKGGFGLKDAPRMWREKLHKLLVDFGMKALQSDRSIYCLWTQDKDDIYSLVVILSTHVDDLKGGGEEEYVNRLIKHLEGHFGKGKTDYKNFEHCGVVHAQTMLAT